MKSITTLLAAALLAAAFACRADEPDKDVPWKALQEIARRGDGVEHVDGFQGADDPIADVMQPPADDSHKWFFTLVTTKGCAACDRLKADFADAPALAPWVDTEDYKRSWSHWQVVDASDATQQWRWANFKPRVFPTLIIQPPYNGSWGDPHTVVFLREGYDGNAATLDQSIRAALGKYAQKVHPQHVTFSRKLAPAALAAGGFEQPIGDWPSPFAPPSPQPATPPSFPNVHPLPQFPQMIPPPEVPPVQPAQPQGPSNFLLTILTLFMGTNLAGTVLLMVLKMLEGRAAATPGKIDDVIVAVLKKVLEGKVGPANPAP